MNNPIFGLIKTIILFILFRVKYDNSVVGKTIEIENKRFTIFRYVKIKNTNNAKAYFLVRFKPIGITPKQNIMFSIFPMMIFMGFKGFCSKYLAVDYSTGLCQGFYEWENVEDAINYSK